MKKEFHQILREKIQEPKISKSFQEPLSTECTDPLHLAFLLGQIQKTHISTSNKSQCYVSSTANTIGTTSQKTNEQNTKVNNSYELLTPPMPPTHFNLQQKNAWLWFWKRGAPLNEKFTHLELQKQFRKLAQVLHPDKNSHPKACETFIQLREHYQYLAALS